MLKSNKMGSVIQINQNDIKHVTGAQFSTGVLCLISAIGSSAVVATAMFVHFERKYGKELKEFQRLKKYWTL